MLIRYVSVVSLVLLSSCTLSDLMLQPAGTGSIDIHTGTVATGVISTGTIDHQPPLVEDISGSGGAYYPIFDGLETRVIPVEHHSGKKTTISFINSEAKSIHVIVGFPLSASGANLRWSQIIMPDGNMDGPFGIYTTLDLTQLGGYTLVFSENMMSGDPWSGQALITLTLSGASQAR